jgi:Glutathione S-transferase, N-terminal domain
VWESPRPDRDYKVPILVPDDGSVVDGSQNIIDWADEHDA